jgi:sugar lactone lactonase YvrE
MRRILLLLAAAAALLAPAAIAKSVFPERIALPDAFAPEGIAIGTGTTFYVGSIPTGAVYVGDLRTGEGRVLVPGAAGRAATGLEHDRGRLWVSGAGTGKAFVYDARSGALLREYQLATGTGGTFVNDVVVTKRAAWFTDSQRPVLYRVALSQDGAPGALTTVPLTGDYAHVAGQFNLNGIDATPSGSTLLAVQSVTGKLFRISEAGVTREVDLGGYVLTNGDGILLHGRTLYVVQNRLNRIAVLRLAPDLLSGSLTRTIVDPDFDVPTTIDRLGSRLYAVNARFGTTTPTDQSYHVVKAG